MIMDFGLHPEIPPFERTFEMHFDEGKVKGNPQLPDFLLRKRYELDKDYFRRLRFRLKVKKNT